MMRSRRSNKLVWRPVVLTTAVLYNRVGHVLYGMRPSDPRGLIVILPKDNLKMRARLLAISRDFERRGGTIALVDEEGAAASVLGSRMEPDST
jgi:hypothetical protein